MPSEEKPTKETKKMEVLKVRRTVVSKQMDRLKEFVNSLTEDATVPQLELRLSALDTAFNAFEELQGKIEELDPDEVKNVEDIRARYEELYYSIQPEITVRIQSLKPNTKDGGTHVQINSAEQLKLPKINMPIFTGEITEWLDFFESFNSLIHSNPSLNKTTKFQYLKSSLGGSASHAIRSLEINSTNYDAAIKILLDRYENKNLICAEHLRKIFEVPAIQRSSAMNLRELIDAINSHLRALSSLGRPVDKWDDLIIYIIVSKLDNATRSKWQEECPTEDPPSLPGLTQFINKRCQVLECFSTNSNVRASTNPISSRKCRSSFCRKCNKPHHTVLHPFDVPAVNHSSTSLNVGATEFYASEEPTDRRVLHITKPKASDITHYSNPGTSIILATAIVHVADKHNTLIPCRILLDSGSQLNLITERFAHILGLPREKSNMEIHGIGSTKTSCKFKTHIILKSRFNEIRHTVEVMVVKGITHAVPEKSIDISDWKIPMNMNLADPQFSKPGRVDVLLGASHFFSLLSVGQVRIDDNLPILQNTVLGWIASGVIGNSCDNNKAGRAYTLCTESHENIETIMKSFSNIEGFAETTPLTTQEQICEDLFIDNFHRLENGRYIVRLPFKTHPRELRKSHHIAMRRFICLEKKLHRDKNVITAYVQFMREYEALCHMRPVDKLEYGEPHFFMPHHCVIKPESSTIKLRVVFDASAKTDSGLSLNDIMHVGPTIQADLFSTALRFRYHKYVFTADITKMYRQVVMHEEDQKFQYILWRESPADKINIYKLCTITYGTSPASFLATRVLYQLANDECDNFPIGADVLKNDFYIDDVLSGANNLNDILQRKCELQSMLGRGGFQLRKWCANADAIISDIPTEDRERLFHLRHDNVVKTLGLIWEPHNDIFKIKVNLQQLDRVTKRTILSDVGRLYDPLGLINPVIVKAKLFMQGLWQSKLHWDEAVSQEMYTFWKTFREDLVNLEKISIKRHVLETSVRESELHAFSDSSERAYGACVYIKSFRENGMVTINLLCAKSKVAPINKHRLTLPRLELCAALMMVQLVEKIKAATKQEFNKYYYWSDSSIVLHWIAEKDHQWTTYIANRVAVIQKVSEFDQWRHVRTKCNPADVLSRGCSPTELISTNTWLLGPTFLYDDEINWPHLSLNYEFSDEELERKKIKCVLHTSTSKRSDILEGIKYRDEYLKLVNTVAFLLRFTNNARAKIKGMDRTTGVITVSERERAIKTIIKNLQGLHYSNEISILKSNQRIPSKSHISSLYPFLDNDIILRVGGRLEHAAVEYEFKHPILLPNNHPFSIAVMKHTHERYHHLGAQGLLAMVRQRYWPISGKVLARQVVRHCVSCFKASPTPIFPVMANLPEQRVSPSRPFAVVGTDFCGPFLVYFKRRGTSPVKAYVAIFICFSTKAVHLELVGDLSTANFLGALRRFFSRRGMSKIVYSDNASNYIGARNELRSLYSQLASTESQESISSTLAQDGIEWRTIPPRSPHFGGIWEAAVKSAKHHMKHVLRLASLTYEEFNTVVIQIESILNSRPLFPLSEDPSDFQPLTPGHFLVGNHLQAIPDPDYTERNLTYLSRWQRVQWLTQQFWRRWRDEYLHTLQTRSKWRRGGKDLQVGDIVTLMDENLPPLKWNLGRVIELHHGKDGIARVATLKTTKGVTKRAIVKLCPLPKLEDHAVLQPGEDVK